MPIEPVQPPSARGVQTSQPSSAPNRFLPRIGSARYHILLSLVAILILGPLGGISAAFMNFKIGFFVAGQVLAGILGSTVTLPYGPEGKHGANYMQTMAASVAGMCAMAVLIQAMVWLGMPAPPAWQLILYFMCIGMFGVGIGMLYTPILVDRMQLTYPSGFAVANIIRALTDVRLLKKSVLKLGSGMAVGFGGGLTALKLPEIVPAFDSWHLSMGTIGAGMIVGARIAIPALVVGIIGKLLTPHLLSIGWLQKGDSYRKIGYVISLGTIMGAALLDITLILIEAFKRYKAQAAEQAAPAEDWKRVNSTRLILWVVFWGAATVIVGSAVLHQPVYFLVVAVVLCFLFVMVNGISQGISDWNPISSAFVMSVFILAALGLKDPNVGLLCASILLIACSEGCDMQQDRSTGWRLGTNRVVQFRYQVVGITMGAVLAVVLARFFMASFPVLKQDQVARNDIPGAEQWQSAMTFKFVGALRGITTSKPQVMKALELGVLIGLGIEITRKLIKRTAGYKRFASGSNTGRVTDFLIDSVFLCSPYASSFGGFVELSAVYWWTAGGIGSSLYDAWQKKRAASKPKSAEGELPADMSTMSLLGGGIIAGDAISALTVGAFGLIKTLISK